MILFNTRGAGLSKNKGRRGISAESTTRPLFLQNLQHEWQFIPIQSIQEKRLMLYKLKQTMVQDETIMASFDVRIILLRLESLKLPHLSLPLFKVYQLFPNILYIKYLVLKGLSPDLYSLCKGGCKIVLYTFKITSSQHIRADFHSLYQRRNILPGSVLLFDVWYITNMKREERVKKKSAVLHSVRCLQTNKKVLPIRTFHHSKKKNSFCFDAECLSLPATKAMDHGSGRDLRVILVTKYKNNPWMWGFTPEVHNKKILASSSLSIPISPIFTTSIKVFDFDANELSNQDNPNASRSFLKQSWVLNHFQDSANFTSAVCQVMIKIFKCSTVEKRERKEKKREKFQQNMNTSASKYFLLISRNNMFLLKTPQMGMEREWFSLISCFITAGFEVQGPVSKQKPLVQIPYTCVWNSIYLPLGTHPRPAWHSATLAWVKWACVSSLGWSQIIAHSQFLLLFLLSNVFTFLFPISFSWMILMPQSWKILVLRLRKTRSRLLS
ncbi:hypothetical protein VP01_510g7 [Puccinia sorghi]|uniref:Uncharacterized protein n=1 Tax=Puccinia sorghi TaxID=27349 RepID=A0A0L6UN56_9BASI|nr:hypothetical protein VP01_510g7 [Puccinia sorghi]